MICPRCRKFHLATLSVEETVSAGITILWTNKECGFCGHKEWEGEFKKHGGSKNENRSNFSVNE